MIDGQCRSAKGWSSSGTGCRTSTRRWSSASCCSGWWRTAWRSTTRRGSQSGRAIHGCVALWCREAEGTEAHRIRGADWRCTVPASNCRCCAGCGGRSCFCAKVPIPATSFHSLGSVAAAGQRRQSRPPPARYGHPYHSGGREAAHLVARSGPVHVPGPNPLAEKIFQGVTPSNRRPGHRPPLRIPAPGADRSRAAIRGGRRRRAGQPQTSLFSPQPGPVRQTSGRARRRAAPSPG